jgi:hypothetical protein
MLSIRTPIAIGLLAAVALPPVALAKDGDVRRSGSCSASSAIKIKLSEEDGRIETEVEVDQNRNGVRWKLVVKRNGTRVAKTHATTRGPSGSFEVRRVISDGAGSDRVTARATSPSGETCTVAANWG